MNLPIAQQRCFHHPAREAAARCPECSRFYCRECITEHDTRVLCEAFLRALNAAAAGRRARGRTLALLIPCAAGFLALWLAFFLVGQALLRVPTSFHEGTLWSAEPEEGAE